LIEFLHADVAFRQESASHIKQNLCWHTFMELQAPNLAAAESIVVGLRVHLNDDDCFYYFQK